MGNRLKGGLKKGGAKGELDVSSADIGRDCSPGSLQEE